MMVSLFTSCWRTQSGKRDDDARLLDLEKWKGSFSPEFIEAGGNTTVQRERVNAMVTQLLQLRDLETLEEEVTKHCIRVVSECTSVVRSSLIVTLAPAAHAKLIQRIQESVYKTLPKRLH